MCSDGNVPQDIVYQSLVLIKLGNPSNLCDSTSSEMQFVGKVITSMSEFYKDSNPALLSGAIDVLVVEDIETGQLVCSPFHVRFGKLKLLRPQEKVVEVRVNGKLMEQIKMKVGEAGETFFVLAADAGCSAAISDDLLTSPLAAPIKADVGSVEPLTLLNSMSAKNIAPIKAKSECGGDSQDDEVLYVQRGAAVSDSELEIGNEWHPRLRSTRGVGLLSSIDPILSTDLPLFNNFSLDSDLKSESPTTKGPMPFTEPKSISGQMSIVSISESIEVRYRGDLVDAERFQIEGDEMLRHISDFEVRSERFNLFGSEAVMYILSNALFGKPPPALNHSSPVHTQNCPVKDSSALEFKLNLNDDKSNLMDSKTLIFDKEKSNLSSVVVINEHGCATSPVSTNTLCTQDYTQTIVKNHGSENISDTRPDVKALFDAVDTGTPLTDENMVPSFKTEDSLSEDSIKSEAKKFENNAKNLPENKQILDIKNNESIKTDFCALNNDDDDHSVIKSTLSEAPVILNDGIISESNKGTSSPWRWWTMSLSTVSNLEDSKSISTKKVPEASPGGTKSISKRLITRGTVPASPTKSEAASSVVSSRSASISSLDGNTSLKSISVATIKYYKSLRLPHEMLIDLNLQPGMNTVSFTVTTRLQGSATCDAHIYLWPNDARVVISDVDGTITKSDVMGHLMYTVGRDWTHSDIANLYTRIAKNGYRFLYLTSRCLGLAASTRGLIKGVKQSQFTLPDGPVITSPDRMLAVLRREVILGNPQEFKIACLKDLQALFNPSKSIDILLSSDLNKKDLLMTKQQGVLVGSQSERSIKREFVSSKNQQSQDLVYNSNNELDSLGCIRTPFYAGFGNRATDSMAYHAVGVPKSRVFIVNPAGNVSIAPIADRFSSSYARLLDLVDSIFPPLAIDNQCFRDHTTRLSHSIPIDTDSEGIAKSKNIPRSNQTVHHDEAFSDFWYWRINNGTTTKMMTALPNIGEQPLETVNMVSENVMTSHEDEEEAVPLTPSFFTG